MSLPTHPKRWWRPASTALEAELGDFLYTDDHGPELFLEPSGEDGFVPLHGVTARVYSNPLTLFIGGVTAVLLELAEPRVRHGVWDHSIFPTNPLLRLRRTGLAAMVTFYAARSVAEGMIRGINARHARVAGQTDKGIPYRADDPALLTWVQATAAYGFIGAYDQYAARLSDKDWATALLGARIVARAYGVTDPPVSKHAIDRLIKDQLACLEPSETLQTFLELMIKTPALPGAARRFQSLLIRAAISLLPQEVRQHTGLDGRGLKPGEGLIVQGLARSLTLLDLRNHPRQLAERRFSCGPGSDKAPASLQEHKLS